MENKIVVIGAGCSMLSTITQILDKGLEVLVNPPGLEVEERMVLEYKLERAQILTEIEMREIERPILLNHRPWERKKKGQRR